MDINAGGLPGDTLISLMAYMPHSFRAQPLKVESCFSQQVRIPISVLQDLAGGGRSYLHCSLWRMSALHHRFPTGSASLSSDHPYSVIGGGM